jgi:hypothetical protein
MAQEASGRDRSYAEGSGLGGGRIEATEAIALVRERPRTIGIAALGSSTAFLPDFCLAFNTFACLRYALAIFKRLWETSASYKSPWPGFIEPELATSVDKVLRCDKVFFLYLRGFEAPCSWSMSQVWDAVDVRE